MTNSDVFGHLREKQYSPQAFETGHAAYDRFLAGALRWEANFRRLEAAGSNDRSVLESEMPFLVQIEEEPSDSLGRAMLINAYAMPSRGDGWVDEQSKMRGACDIFYDFTRGLPHARITVDDAAALLNEIPEALMQDKLQLFDELFFKSFPHNAAAPLREAMSDFLERFYDQDILACWDAEAIIARHERLWVYFGRDPLDLPFYRERKRVFDLARQQAARFIAELGPVHTRFATSDSGTPLGLPPELRLEFQAELAAASKAARGQMIADSCRAHLRRASSKDADRWATAGVPLLASNLRMPHADLIAQLRLPMDLTQDQACAILEYMALHGSRHTVSHPMLDYPLAARLARSLPVGRADLERLVKNTGYKTDQSVKDILIDALRGEKRGPLERLLRRFFPRAFSPEDRPALWADWIDAKRKMLVTEIATRPPLGVAAPASAQVGDWGGVRGQVYDLDVVGYAKRVALAQSNGADIATSLDDLRSLGAMIRANLEVLEASHALADVAALRVAADPLVGGTDTGTKQPSLFGLWAAPTPSQLAECERRTLAALDRLIARIALCERHPDLMPYEARMWDMTKGQDFSFSLTLLVHSINMVTRDGVPDGLFERLDGFDFSLLDGPYIVDTEPSFSTWELECWRSSIQALAALPEKVAGPRIEAIAQTVFAPELDPDRCDYTFAPKGYGQDVLATAVIRTLMAMPEATGAPTLVRLQARASSERLQDRFYDAIRTVR